MKSHANTELVNNAGFNAFQIALEQSLDGNSFTGKKLAAVYQQLAPDCLDIQVDGRLIKLDNHLMAMFYTQFGKKIVQSFGGAFQSADFAEAVKNFPEHILPERRKKQSYISSILSKNAAGRDDKYNRKLCNHMLFVFPRPPRRGKVGLWYQL